MSWHITNQHQTSVLTPANTFEDVMEITATSDATGVGRTIRVPISAYTPQRVQAEMDAAFDTVHAVHALTGK